MAEMIQAQEAAPAATAAPTAVQEFDARLESAVHTVLQVTCLFSSDASSPGFISEACKRLGAAATVRNMKLHGCGEARVLARRHRGT